ncbi:UDP-glycosyltransferase 74E1 [Amborella trichopoda]|uniref:Glycosyltransferase n=1 Tax=Amborella trichopoda TaxID=13333 RepID=U5DDK2_AMBTC|nr:UDP-glycosyltransferase 74E1 [Amborella trichopoda]ERN20305.1 hypothetical protein AMTR_s00066p00179760 [Amborella trichopoda]|eukprot:XP_006858838.1 UDP-glycosyltransferase 74E1 [Amborella trichopoda]
MEEGKAKSSHVLVLPYPIQGHINPLLQFADRLASKGVKASLVVPLRIHGDILHKVDTSTLATTHLEYISDGCDDGLPLTFDPEAYDITLQRVGSQTLGELIGRLSVDGQQPVCLIYDSILPWALDIAHAHGILGVTFLTQSYAVSSMYSLYHRGALVMQAEPDACFSLPGMPPLGLQDLPKFIAQPEADRFFLELLLGQFKNIDKADYVLLNSFDCLEAGVIEGMAEPWSPKMIGPALPSLYLDSRNTRTTKTGDEQEKLVNCLGWVNERPDGSVVYVSFGSLASLITEQMEEIASALRSSKRPFLWVVKPPRAHEQGRNSLPDGFLDATTEQGLVVPWCPQLDVLAHRAIGCFVTHCGWNSTLEAISQGVPMVAVPQWSDQPTNAKFISDVWKMGIRVEVDDKKMVQRGELERCIREIMDGEKGAEFRENAQRWKGLARAAVAERGTSDNNIEEFVAMVSRCRLKK